MEREISKDSEDPAGEVCWYAYHGGSQRGPLSLREMEQFVRPETMVWRDGMKQWTTASQLPEFRQILSSQAYIGHTPSEDQQALKQRMFLWSIAITVIALMIAVFMPERYTSNGEMVVGAAIFVGASLIMSLLVWFLKRNAINLIHPVLVLRRFEIDPPDGQETVVRFMGRESGFFSWLFTWLGVDGETSLVVDQEKAQFRSSGLTGETIIFAPLSQIATTQCGFTRPIYLLALAISSFIGCFYFYFESNPMIGFGLVMLAMFFFAMYAFGKSITVIIVAGGEKFGLSFSRSAIENVALDFDQTLRAIDRINETIAMTHQSGMR